MANEKTPLYVETEGGGMKCLDKAPSKPPRVKVGPGVKVANESAAEPKVADPKKGSD